MAPPLSVAPAGLAEGVRRNDPIAISRAISLVENGGPGFEHLLSELQPAVGRAHRVGLTGPPGAGKSTLAQGLALTWRSAGHTVAVVAVDPTSPRTGGALLGDRIRMERVALDQGVYIRSMATRGARGGLALTTREACDVLDAAGYQRIMVETVGVGQAELEVVAATDTVVLVLVPESGDGIQALKSGLIEMADLLVVNKADRAGADRMAGLLEAALRIRREAGRDSGSSREGELPVLATVATEGRGLVELAERIEAHHTGLAASGALSSRRAARRGARFRAVLERALARRAWELAGGEEVLSRLEAEVVSGRLTAYEAAERIAARLGVGERTPG